MGQNVKDNKPVSSLWAPVRDYGKRNIGIIVGL